MILLYFSAMIGSTYNEQQQIIEAKFKGEIELEELLHFVFNIGQNRYLPTDCKMVIDATQSVFNFGVSELEVLKNNIEASTNRFTSFNCAIIHQNSNDTALSIMLEREHSFSKYQHKTFCTIEAAKEWLIMEVAC